MSDIILETQPSSEIIFQTQQSSEVKFPIAQGIKGDLNLAQVSTYALMILLPVNENLKIVKVLNDENKGIQNTIYHIYPDGTRMWVAATQDN